ncbi:hypothetical protein BU24DRAFT_453304 [Aaosphaeria arxii CBS 175.79]|uniref:SnoaL-like domain-containing protein n=1 Tax=Aaosphaeria arxii CBS 175.79 TaxID=1450172 RepID=A0A6A5XL60_9PLEO|nr:uncharacterized protein BU24DRAFT_453304 [Aaosphaeria arxii CBS 175.79]KAF2013034.1 hypothetical protein BU24DRAFT_453304 [Aaosphaeria arxii CBS 175.79]
MTNLNFTNSEIRLTTAALASVAALVPAAYFLLPKLKTLYDSHQESTRQQHLETFHSLLRAYSTLQPSSISALASPTFFTHTILPSSLEIPSRDLAPFTQHATQIFSLFSSFQMIPQGTIHFAPGSDAVIAHCKMGGTVNGESESGKKLVGGGLREWWTECVLMVRMEEGGKRITEIREFVHSAKAEELKKRIMGVFEG